MAYEPVLIYALAFIALTVFSTKFTNRLHVVELTAPIYVFTLMFTATSPYIIDFPGSYTLIFLLLASSTTINAVKHGKVPFLNYIHVVSLLAASAAPLVYNQCVNLSVSCLYFTARFSGFNYVLFALAVAQILLINTAVYVERKMWFNFFVTNLFSLNNLIPLVLPSPTLWLKNATVVPLALGAMVFSRTIGRRLYSNKGVDDIHDIYLLLNIPLVFAIVLTLFIAT